MFSFLRKRCHSKLSAQSVIQSEKHLKLWQKKSHSKIEMALVKLRL